MQKIVKIIKERKFKYISIFWIIISIQFVIGSNLQNKGYSIRNMSDFCLSLVKVLLLSIIFIGIHYCVLELKKNFKIRENKKIDESKLNKYKGIIYFLIIVVCWIPVFLAFFPIISNYDGRLQIITFIMGNNTTRHPILHTLMLTKFYLFGYKYLNSSNIGMALFSIFQMSIMAIIFSYSVRFVEKETKKVWLRDIVILFYAFFPYNQLFSIMTTKDTLFAGFTLLFIIELYNYMKYKKRVNYVFFIISGVLMLLFRNNAIYAIVMSMPIIVLLIIKDKRKTVLLMLTFIIIIVIYQIINIVLMIVTDTKRDISQEKLSIFSQAVAKVCKENENELNDYEKEKINFYFEDYKKLGQVYKSNISDETKRLINCENVDSNLIDFLKFAIKLGSKYPGQYIDSFLNTSRGYWYICDNSFNQILHNEFPDTMGCLELCFKGIGIEKCGIYNDSKIPVLQFLYRRMFAHNDYRNIPVIYIIFQPAMYFYIVFAYLLYSIYIKDKKLIIIGIYFTTYFITCFLGPVAIIRYIYAIIVSVPVLLGLILKENKGR